MISRCWPVVTLACALVATTADAQTKQECSAAYTESQHLRSDGKLREARTALVTCSNPACPAALRPDCMQWLGEVERAIPSIAIEAVNGRGEDVSQVRVRIDGAVVAERLDGRAIEVDPGERIIRLEGPNGEQVERRVLVTEGDKLRKVHVELSPRSSPTPAAAAPAPPPAPPETAQPASSPPIAGWVVGAAGIVALGVGIGLDISGKTRESDLKNTCAPLCAQSDVDSMRRTVLVGDIVAGVGIAAIAVGIIILVTHGSSSSRRAASPTAFALPRR